MVESISRISKDWEPLFPSLKKYNKNSFYEILGPFIVGIKLSPILSLDCYRPSLIIIGLWEKAFGNMRQFFNHGFMFENFGYSIGKTQLGVKFPKHEEEYFDVVKTVKKEIKINLGQDININDFLDGFNFWINHEDPKKERHSYQAEALVYKVMLFKYLKKTDDAEQVLNQIILESENWDLKIFEMGYGPFKKWFDSLTRINNDELIQLVNKNKLHSKLNKLPQFKICT